MGKLRMASLALQPMAKIDGSDWKVLPKKGREQKAGGICGVSLVISKRSVRKSLGTKKQATAYSSFFVGIFSHQQITNKSAVIGILIPGDGCR